jgi:hypothetical protein
MKDKAFLYTTFAYLLCLVAMIALMGRPFTYPLDDTYIHLAIGRTLANTGIWGVQATDPAAASSSPLYSLLMAGLFSIIPVGLSSLGLYLPLLINVVMGTLLVFLWYKVLAGSQWRITGVVLLACAVPLFTLSILGMEHVMHVLLATALAVTAARMIAAETPARPLILATLAALAVATRYESVFLIGPLFLWAAARRQWGNCLALAIGGAVPVLAFGLFWMSKGGFFLPNPIIVKRINPAEVHGALDFVSKTLGNLRANLMSSGGLTLVALTLGSVLLLTLNTRNWARFRTSHTILATAVITATLGQLALAVVSGWLYRYEAWLIALNVLTFVLLLGDLGLRSRVATFALLVMAAAATPRAAVATVFSVLSGSDRRLEHVGPAEFVHDYYPGGTVAVNDLGAMAYLADSTRFLDIYGLGNNEPVRFRMRNGGYKQDSLREWAEQTGARIAVVQICWGDINARLPAEWPLVALWRIPRNIVFRDQLVAFLAVAPGEAGRLTEDLRQFAPPDGVTIRYFSDTTIGAALPQVVASTECSGSPWKAIAQLLRANAPTPMAGLSRSAPP